MQWLTSPLCVLPTQVKATSNALKSNVLNVKGGEHLLMLAGFKPQVWGGNWKHTVKLQATGLRVWKLLGSFLQASTCSCWWGSNHRYT